MTTLDRCDAPTCIPTPPWRPLLIAGLFALCTMPAAAQGVLQFEAKANSLRFALPDAVYATGVAANFAGLYVSDASGTQTDFAICAIQTNPTRVAQAPLVALPDIARLEQTEDGRLRMSFPPGANHPGMAQQWIIDLRAIDGATARIDGLPEILSVRSSPNLQQWSAPLAFRQSGDSVRFEPLTTPFLRVRLRQSQTTEGLSAQLDVAFRARFAEPELHWFVPTVTDDLVLNPRHLPVTAARAQTTSLQGEGRIESRQGNWDAWKPRARVPVGQSGQTQRFSGVTDPQWRTRGPLEGLELAHTAYEVRIPRIAQGSLYTLSYAPGSAATPRLSCRQTEALAASEPHKLRLLDASSASESAPGNLRNGFLLLVATLAAVGFAVRKYRDRGSKR